MKWNYRVVTNGDEHYLIEAYYDADGNLTGWCEASIPHETHDDLIGGLRLMLAAAEAGKLTSPQHCVIWREDLP